MSAGKAGRMNCDRLARHYEILERLTFGRRLEKRRFAFLAERETAERALLCGDGDGRFLAELLRVNAGVRVDFVDLSEGMIAIAERRVRKMGESFRERVRFFACDVMEFEPAVGGYDLISAHFFLDCFSEEEIGAVVGRVAGWGARDARWVVSEFCEAETSLKRAWTRAVISGLYAAFRLTTGLRVTRLPDYARALAARGFCLRKRETDLGGLLCSGVWESSLGRAGYAPGQLFENGRKRPPVVTAATTGLRSASSES
ncbi:MAG: class I SAM-dependent methyltransferase [Candidatus Acidiferrum sp.]|jgi:ubiquinone/menaquinone biosynthesis C-methylase UbiE